MQARTTLNAALVAASLALTAAMSTVFAQTTTAPADTWQAGELGETLVVPMANAPYPHDSRKDGFKNGDKTFPREPHYVDNSVAVFIPKGYKPGEAVDLLFYFHGHMSNLQSSFDKLKLREQIAAAGKNIIAVFPEGPKNAADSGCGKLDDKDGLKRLAEEVLDRLVADKKIPTRRLGRVLLAGHSGAYRVISMCLDHGGLEEHVTDVCLLDASYGQLDTYVNWISSRSTARFFSIFTDHLAGENAYLMTHLRERRVAYELLAEQFAKDPIVRDTRILFLYAEKLDHNGTVQWLQRWLAGTSLPQKACPTSNH